MRQQWIIGGSALVILATVAVASARMAEKLPPGPIRDRHELMEGIGKNAKIIGNAMKAHNFAPIAAAAEKIQTASTKIVGLFPKGSTNPKSRAKPNIWTHWAKFEAGAKALGRNAGALAAAAKSGGDVHTAANTMFKTCKGCHDTFRKPKKKK